MKIILVEDEVKVGKITCAYLEKAGYKIDWYQDGKTGWVALEQALPDLIILDLMLPYISGEEICRRLRSRGVDVPILMLTARGLEEDRIKGLEMGADDYLVKPFSLGELLARIQAILRRVKVERVGSSLAQRLIFTSGDKTLEIDLTHQIVRMNGDIMDLTATEFNLLAILAQNPRRPFSREELIVKT